MNTDTPPSPVQSRQSILTRRQFLGGTSAAALSLTVLKPELVRGAAANSKIDLGLIGCGGRGRWITDLFLKHGGYNLAAVMDYFPDKTDAVGEKFGVPPAKRFTGLSGHKRLLEEKLDAVVIQSPPYFHPEQAAAAVDAGKHAYVAKPVAVDVPGCRLIEACGKRATQKKLCFLVDFQTRAHPSYQEAVKWVRQGEIGRLVSIESNYLTSTMFATLASQLKADPSNPELRLRAWPLDRVLSGDVITEQNIHTLDVVTWFTNADPVRAYGTGGLARGFGTCWDHFHVIFYFPDDLQASFLSKQVGHGIDDIMCRVYGENGYADTHYFGEVSVRSKEDAFNGGRMTNLYTDGTVSNIATFHDAITKGDYSNPTVAPSVRSNLTTILGRLAAYKKREVTWDEMLKANEKWEFKVKGLRA
jgi:predicted dehydrogenase